MFVNVKFHYAKLCSTLHYVDLPEAYILTAGYDVLRDEGIMYANKLRHHGVEVTLVNKETAVHGCWSMDIPSAVKHRWDTYEYIKHML